MKKAAGIKIHCASVAKSGLDHDLSYYDIQLVGNDMTTVAVIIARAGSEGFANKSLQLLKGKPVIAWPIEHALNCRYVDAIVLSSDCPRTLAVGCEYQISVYERPAHLATNVATIDAGVRHGIECWEHESGQR